MNLGGVFSCSLVLLFLVCQATCEDTYDIPVTINPLIQGPVKTGSNVKFFYDKDKSFYSKVTVIDAAINAEQRVQDIIKKTINVVFLTIASSRVSGTLNQDDLRYKTKSNWSYTVDVNSILEASQGTLTSIGHDTVIYKIQENAMKVLEERFQFQSSEILTRLSLESMDYYAVDEAKWINVVGIIVEKVIVSRSEALHLTSCYLADMVGKTVAQMQGFTLKEVDMHIYNTTMLLGKLPEYRDNVTKRLYQTFKMTPTDLASISNTNVSEINNMILHDVLQLFTNSVLEKLRVTTNEITEKDSSFDPEMLLSCTDKWNSFLAIIIAESFHNSAEAMVIEVETLSALINIPYTEIKQFTITEMINLLEVTIDPLSAEKKLVEATLLSVVLKLHGLDKIDNNDNIFEVIYRFTNFTERQLTTLYEWTSGDYLFSSMFTLEEVNKVCTIDPLEYDLLALARLTVGQVGDIQCQSFNVLREIWDRKNVNFLEYKYSSGEQLPLDTPISMMVSQLTKAPSTINYRVLNITSEAEELISKLSINNITEVTTYQSPYLKTLSFQDIIGIIVHLKRNGSFDRQVVSHYFLTSLTPSLMFTPTHIYTTNNKFPTSTGQKSHTTTAMLNISHDSDEHVTVPTSSNPLSSKLLELTTTAHIPQYTTMQISDQINTTIPPKRTNTVTKTRQSPSSTTKEYLNSEFVSISYSKILARLSINNITSSHNSATLKYSLDDYSKSTTEQIFPSYHVSTDHVSSATTSHPNSSSVSLDRNSHIKTMKNSSFAKSAVPLLITPSLPESYSSNANNLANINHTTSQQHFIEYTSTSHSGMISSSKDLNGSKTVISQGYYQYNISSTRTVPNMTGQTVTVSQNIDSNVTVADRSKELKPSTVQANVTFSPTSKNLSGSRMNTFSPRLNSSNKLNTNVSQTKDYSVPASVHQSNTNTSLNTQSLLTEIILSTTTESRVPSLTPKRKFTTTTNDMTSSVTLHNTTSYTTSTKVMVNTTKSSPAMAGIDASSKGDFSSRANNSSPNTISLVIQTTRIESTMLTSIKTTTTTIVIPEEMTSSARVEPSSTMNVFTTNTIISTQGPPTEEPSTNINHPTTMISAVDKPSLNINSHTTSINVPHIQTSSSYLSTIALPTPPISSQPTKVSTTLLAISMASSVKPSTTKSGASSSSIQKPAATCQPECKAHEWCISNSQTAICKVTQNLEGNFRITSGANFTVDLKNKSSDAFKKLAIQIEKLIDSICKRSQYLSAYLGAQVSRFEQGSIIVFYKLSFENVNGFALSDDTVEDIAQVFRNAQDTNFTIDNSSISIEDFDECSSGLATKCHTTATCNNTLGSYECICPKGAAGDGTSCQVVNSAQSEDKEDVPWIIYVVIAIMVLLIIFLIVVIIYCEKKHKKKHRPQVLDFHNGGINMYPRSTSYLAQTPESEADLADGLGIVNRHAPPLNMVTFNPTPDDKKELELQKGQPGMLLSFKRIEPA